MKNEPHLLLTRLEEIGQALAGSGRALALLGLGSVGVELDRLDGYSDLDFFVIVREGAKADFLDRLDWLQGVQPIAFAFKNTADGYKLLFQDNIFCEFAIFEPAELSHIPYSEGRIVWCATDFDPALSQPQQAPPAHSPHNPDWLVNEALTNLYVGLARYRRGEKLSAMRFIQGYAVDRLLQLAAHLEAAQPAHVDSFVLERRFEQRFPLTSQQLATFLPGYGQTPQAAQAILAFLEGHFWLNPALTALVVSLIHE